MSVGLVLPSPGLPKCLLVRNSHISFKHQFESITCATSYQQLNRVVVVRYACRLLLWDVLTWYVMMVDAVNLASCEMMGEGGAGPGTDNLNDISLGYQLQPTVVR